MLSRQLTVVDLCKLTGYSRNQVHGLLKLALPDSPSKGERFAREFRYQDMILVAVMTELETRFGIKRDRIAVVAKRLAQVLSGPREPNREVRLIVSFNPPKVIYAPEPRAADDVVVMALGPIFERADNYVQSGGELAARQHPLRLGPAVVRQSAKRSSA